MVNGTSRTLVMLALLAVAGGPAVLGRLGFDWLIGVAPRSESEIERFGGWALGMIIGLLVVIPVFRMYGVFSQGERRARFDQAASKAGSEAKNIRTSQEEV